MEEELLLELKALNERLTKDFELRSEQLKIEQARFENELELQSIAEAEKVEQDAQLELDRAKSEQRALQIEQYIEKVQSDEELEKQELSRQEMIQAINEIDNTDTLTQINEKLTELIEVNQKTEIDEIQGELNYFNSRAIMLTLLFFIPLYLTIRWLNSFFNSASAF